MLFDMLFNFVLLSSDSTGPLGRGGSPSIYTRAMLLSRNDDLSKGEADFVNLVWSPSASGFRS